MAAWTWIFAQNILQAIIASYPTVFESGTVIYENIGPSGTPDTVSGATVNPYQNFDDYATMLAGPINSAAKGLMYDNESWTNTPTDEQQSPEAYMRLYAQHAQSLGLFMIHAPGNDLATKNGANHGVELPYVYLEFGRIMAESLQQVTTSAIPSIAHVQAQSQLPGYSSITTMEQFGAMISTVKSQMLPKLPAQHLMSAGITLNTTVTTAPPLISAVQMMRDYGYPCCWFNVPGSTFTSTQLGICQQVIQAAQAVNTN